ncbi:hypothetical protein ACOMHN_035674 [Nucella lapillus]
MRSVSDCGPTLTTPRLTGPPSSPLYHTLPPHPLFFTPVKGGHWVCLRDAVLMTSPAEELDEAADEAVVRVYTECQVSLVRLPPHVMNGLTGRAGKAQGIDQSESITTVSVEHLSAVMKRDDRWSTALSAEQKLLVLDYLCRRDDHDHDPALLQDLALIPTTEGRFCTWDQRVFVCREERDVQLLSGLRHQTCFLEHPEGLQAKIQALARRGFGELQLVSEDNFPELLKASLEGEYGELCSIVIGQHRRPWVKELWDYLLDHDLDPFDLLPLLPCPQGKSFRMRPLCGNYVCERLKGYPKAFPQLSAALVRLGVEVVPSLPDFVLKHQQVLNQRVQPPSFMGVLKSLATIWENTPGDVEDVVNEFNAESSAEERGALVESLHSRDVDHDPSWEVAKSVLRQLALFPLWPQCRRERSEPGAGVTAEHGAQALDFSSVEDCDRMTPGDEAVLPPPLALCPPLLYCPPQSPHHHLLASHLGARELSLRDLIKEVMTSLSSPHHGYPDVEVKDFMLYFLRQSDGLAADGSLMNLARSVSFVPSVLSGNLHKAGDLYHPHSPLLPDLLAGEDLFPSKTLAADTLILDKLKGLGLRDVVSVSDQHLVKAAKNIQKLCSSDLPLAQRRGKALWDFVKQHGQRYGTEVIKTLSSVRCVPCVQQRKDVPRYYPSQFPVCPEPFAACGMARAVDLCPYSDFKFVACVRPVSLCMTEDCVLRPFCRPHPSPEDLLGHLETLIATCKRILSTKKTKLQKDARFLLVEIFRNLKQNATHHPDILNRMKDIPCVMVDGQFRRAADLWVQEEEGDVRLAPFRYSLPPYLAGEDLGEFFLHCGSSGQQDVAMLQQVLGDIHTQGDPPDQHLTLVLTVLRAVKEKGGGGGDTLLPVYAPEAECLRMERAQLCTVAPDPDYIEALVEETDRMAAGGEGEAVVFVHPSVEAGLALALGAKDFTARLMTGVDDLNVDDSSFGQSEPLTTRLHNLLKDGYTDGFSVPKELVQNADDAGAKVVKFLVDGRTNSDWRNGLLTPELADFQGPALWVFNDAQFTESDFANLCKLGGATKKEDCSKVGRFGLGFNAVYNLTDLPSIYSGSTLALLDPHEKHLHSGRGKKINFKDIINRLMLKRMPQQFRPFQGVFDCRILDPDWTPYSGTLFRFPFRTEPQALKSEICKEAFTRSKQQDFLNGLQDKGGNLLLFLQHVEGVEVQEISEESPDPRDPHDPSTGRRVMTVSKARTSGGMTPQGGSILDHFSAAWKTAVEEGEEDEFEEEEVVEQVKLSMEMVAKGNRGRVRECRFWIAWAAGRREACDVAREMREEGFVPLAAVAVCVDSQDKVKALASCPSGFYNKGHLFCFLPLAEQVSETSLALHINAPFALSSDRRTLLCETEDDRRSIGGRWNQALFSDPIPRAYLACLQTVAPREAEGPGRAYYNLWPRVAPRSSRTPQSALPPAFYRLLHEEEFRVLLHPDGPVPFSRAFFLEPDFRHEVKTGAAAFRVLETFWTSTVWSSGDGCLIDLPKDIATNITSSGDQAKTEFQERIVSEEQFFRDVLFPRIKDEDPNLEAGDRNQLVLYALLSNKPVLQELVKHHCCIPCAPDGALNPPARLVHPEGRAAALYLEEEGRFPRKEGDADFTRAHVLIRLQDLGMVRDTVSREELVERAASVAGMGSKEAGSLRARAIIKYLPSLGEKKPEYAGDLRDIPFLPTLQKPADWPASWFVDAHPGHDFVQPSQAYCEELKDLVGCQAAVVEESLLELAPADRVTLEELCVVVHRAKAICQGPTFTQLVVNHLLQLSEDVSQLHPGPSPSSIIHHICKIIYQYFNYFCKGPKTSPEREVMNCLKDRAVVWKNGEFLTANQLAFSPQDDLRPYLITLDATFSSSFPLFFQFLGVPQCFSVADILEALRRFKEDKPGKLTKKDVKLICKMAELLRDVLKSERKGTVLEEIDTRDLHLPGQDKHLHAVEDLCLDDCEWLSKSGTMFFLHSDFSESLAHVFRVKTKREHDEDEFSEPFGQHEQLTTRINRLLEGYKRDTTIFKELLQNADDAGASQVVFIKDYRHHNTERLINENWKEVLRPALCVFNDAPFTTDDLVGIQALGEGSKEGDALKTGKYGVGFNAVYNLTDTPCFSTTVQRPPDHGLQVNEQQLGENICLLDPNFFVVSRRSKRPGQRLLVKKRFKEQYSNMLAPFDLGTITQGKKGTVLRLPLRTKEKENLEVSSATVCMGQNPEQRESHVKSKIKQPAVSMKKVEALLEDFKPIMGESLLFLNHLKRVSVFTAHKNGKFTLDYHTRVSMDESNAEKQRAFSEHVGGEAKKVKSGGGGPRLQDFGQREAAVQCCVSDSQGKQEDWLVVHRFGLTHTHALPACLHSAHAVQKYRLLPLAGVAICLSPPPPPPPLPSARQTRYRMYQNVQRGRAQPVAHRGDPVPAQRSGESTTTREAGPESGSSPLPEEEEEERRVFQAFCMLPLPVTTGLPVHVNARFALDHETRGNLYSRPDDDQWHWNKVLANDIIVPAYVTALSEIQSLCFAKEAESLDAETQPESETSRRAAGDKGVSMKSSADLSWKLDHYTRLFPQHHHRLDAFWNQLVTSFYQQLEQREVEAFPCVREDLNRLLWVPARKSQGFPGYFWDLSEPRLKGVLKKLNMNIIQCPFRIHDSFQGSGVDTVKKVEGETVIEFLLSCHQSGPDSCGVKNLPQPVQNTPFEAAENVVQVFLFIQTPDKTTELKHMPLSLRMSGDLHCFSSENPTIVSIFCDLLPESNKRFLDNRLINHTPIPFQEYSDNLQCPDYLQRLDVGTFAQLLSHTLPQDTFGCGEIIPEHQLSSRLAAYGLSWGDWIRRLWQFLDSERPSVQQVENLLGKWSLLPSLKDKECLLFPVQKKDEVVHIVEERPVQMQFMPGVIAYPVHGLSQVGEQRQDQLAVDELNVNQSLEKLSAHLHKLNTGLLPPEHCIAMKMVASVRNPTGLLKALSLPDFQPQGLFPLEAQNILDFFYGKLYEPDVSGMRFLPFFERPDGTLTSLSNTNVVLCLPKSVPLAGLADWSGSKSMCLLKTNYHLKNLFQMLSVKMPTPSDFYSSYLLPSIRCLPKEAIPVHMEYIRDCLLLYDKGILKCSLQETQFITGHDGTLCKASDFYDPDHPVFNVMLTENHFPPAPYHESKWKTFLRKIGMICNVSEKMFLRFAREVQEAGKQQSSEKVQRQSRELSKCLKTSSTLQREQFLKQLKNLKFLLPLQPCQMRNGEHLVLIHPAFTPPTPLISFSQSLSPKWTFLAWTTICLLSDDSDPLTFQHWGRDMYDWIGFQCQPSKDLVIKHVKNICQSLGMKGPDSSYILTTFSDSALEVVKNVMEAVYEHLNSFGEDDLTDLQEVRVVFDREKRSMFTGQQVVISILEEQVIEGHVVRAPEALGTFFSLFRKLGACEQVSAVHYARALKEIHGIYLENTLGPNDLKLVSKAVDLLFYHLKFGENTISKPVYLPAVDITSLHEEMPLVRLVDSRKILLAVNYVHQKRIKTPINNHLVFTGFILLGLKNHDLRREAKLLPEHYRMKEWDEVVKEVLEESCRTLAAQDENAQFLTSQLHSEAFADVVKRIVNHDQLTRGQPFTEEDAGKIEEDLKKITVLKVTNMKTVLQMDGCPQPGTEQNKNFFVTKDVKVSIFISSHQRNRVTFQSFGFVLSKAVLWAVGFKIEDTLLVKCLENLPNAQQELDNREIREYDIQRQPVFPPPGSFVPLEMHCLLVQDFYEYKVNEYVAYELYDPVLDSQRTDCEETAEDIEETCDEERTADRTPSPSQSKNPVYIFAVVRRVLSPPTHDVDDRTRLMLFRYVINIGEEKTKEVEATELYKFVRPSHNVLVPFTGDTTPPPSACSDSAGGDDLKKVLSDIRHQLKEIWKNFSDSHSRNRAVKRLLLKWHPDKNPEREKFCTTVFQKIQQYVALLKQGKELPSDDDNVGNYDRASRSGGSFYGDFFDDIFSRGRSYRDWNQHFSRSSGGGRFYRGYNRHSRSSGGGSFFFDWGARVNPQQEEGKRWLRQSLQDLKAAKLTLSHGGEGLYNWVCYQAHQTAEKALKALLYQRDANHSMKTSHDILCLADCIGDIEIQTAVNSLNSVVSNDMCARYPDLHIFPKIPSDVYGRSEADQAYDSAEQVVKRAQHLFDAYQPPSPSPPRPSPPPRRSSPPRSYAVSGGSSGCLNYGSRRSAASLTSSSGQLQGPTPAKVPRRGSY